MKHLCLIHFCGWNKVSRYTSLPNKGGKTATASWKGPRHENISRGEAVDEILELGDCSIALLPISCHFDKTLIGIWVLNMLICDLDHRFLGPFQGLNFRERSPSRIPYSGDLVDIERLWSTRWTLNFVDMKMKVVAFSIWRSTFQPVTVSSYTWNE